MEFIYFWSQTQKIKIHFALPYPAFAFSRQLLKPGGPNGALPGVEMLGSRPLFLSGIAAVMV